MTTAKHLARVAAALLWLGAVAACGEGGGGGGNAPTDAGNDSSLASDAKLVTCFADTDCPKAVTACAVASCSPAGFCIEQPAAAGATCDDGDPCTADTVCSNGACVGSFVCECQSDGDCDGKRAADLCGPAYYCDLTGAMPLCRPKPNSAVACDTSLDTACSVSACDKADGACKATAVADGAACDDGALCTGPDACKGGICTGPSSCACEADADCLVEEDGDPCNGTLYCDKTSNTCKVDPTTVVICAAPAPGACSGMVCDPTDKQCKPGPLPDGKGCDLDGSVCSLDACAGGACKPGPLDAPCACEKDADCGIFEDGDVCNGTLYCSKATGFCELNPATLVSCSGIDDTACIHNQCNAKTGQCSLAPVADGTPCEDGWECSTGEACAAGACKAAKNVCECKTTPDCGAFAAQNQCAQFYCDKPAGLCKINPASVKVCAPAGA